MNKEAAIKICLLLILCLGIFLRVYNLSTESIWYDEAASIHLASSNPADLVQGKVRDIGNPPFHTIILHYWIRIFGDGEAAVRSLSVIFGILSLFLIYKIAKLLLNTRIALLSAFIFAISPLHVYKAQEARTYTLVTFLCLASMLLFIKFIKNNRTLFQIGYTIVSFLSIYSHYFAFFILMAQNIFLAINWKRYKHSLNKWIIAQASIFLLYAAFWLPSLISQIGIKGNLGRYETTWLKHILFTPVFYSIGRTLIWDDSPTIKILIYLPLVLLIFGIPFILGVLRSRKDKEPSSLVHLWLLAPIIIPALISVFFFPLYCGRYSVMASPAYYILISLGIFSIKKVKTRIIFVSGIILLSALSLTNYYTHSFKFEWRQAANYIKENAGPQDAVLFDADFGETPFSYYYKGSLKKIRLYSAPNPDDKRILGYIAEEGARREDFTEEINSRNRVWLVLSYNYTDGAKDFYPKLLSGQRKRIVEKKYKGIDIYLYTLPSG